MTKQCAYCMELFEDSTMECPRCHKSKFAVAGFGLQPGSTKPSEKEVNEISKNTAVGFSIDTQRLIAMMEKEDWVGAVALMIEAIKVDPGSYSGWVNYGAVLYGIVQQNCRMFASDSFAWLVLLFDKSGRIHGEAKRRIRSLAGPAHVSRLEMLLDEAVRCFDKAIELNPTSNAYLWRGMLYRDTGQFDQAESDLKRAADLDKGRIKENAHLLLNALHRFDWAKVSLDAMSSEFAYISIEEHYGRRVSSVVEAIRAWKGGHMYNKKWWQFWK